MQIEINVCNGSGWNNYAALRGQRLNRILKVSRLAAKNHLSRIEVGPRDVRKPFGIEARFYRLKEDEDRLVYAIQFDQNDTAEWIAERVKLALTKGFVAHVEANLANRAAKALAAAKAAGFETVEAHVSAVEAAKVAKIAAASAKNAVTLADTAGAAEALADLTALRVAHPDASRIGRQGQLIRSDESKVGVSFTRLAGMKGWLYQHGFRASLDDRHHFFAAAR